MSRNITTAMPFDNHRSTPLSMSGQYANALQASGVVDFLWLWDEFSSWFPECLLKPDQKSNATGIDSDSTYDPFIQAAVAAALNPRIGLRLSTDALRSGPGELLRRVLTLANATDGQVVLAIGAGEQRQAKPFGYKRAEGLARLEDTFRLIQALYDSNEPVTYEGKQWHFQNAFLGNSRPQRRPEFWALGGGPMLLDIAARYADGFEAAVPQAITTPEAFGQTARMMREKVEGYGRDPDKFGLGIWLFCVMHEDPHVVDTVLDHPLVKYFAGLFGRLDQSQWVDEGFARIMPEGWHYANKWVPYDQTPAEINDIVARVPREMARAAYHTGAPAEVTRIARQYVEGGADFVGMIDMTPLALGPGEGVASFQRSIKILNTLKQQ